MSELHDGTRWAAAAIPSQTGRTAVVTGANSGVGFETALALAKAGGTVVVASRSAVKGEAAASQIQAAAPGAGVAFELLDLASLASVGAFAERLGRRHDRLDLLVNNAGVMEIPRRETTADGFELQFGVNHLGHFALTLHLAPLLRRAAGSRIVTVSSIRHKTGQLVLDDLQWERRRYSPDGAYDQSKLANLSFARELQRRNDAIGGSLTSLAAHPGIARTEIIANGPGLKTWSSRLISAVQPLTAQSAAQGALPILFAATSPAARPGGYYGPTGFMEMRGATGAAHISARAQDERLAERLWEASEALVGRRFT
jgi:NAD(P)-dependent dehydrogenase (short-subunit alcohol dehydrogenase family)